MQETISYLLAQVCKAHRAAASAVLSEAGLHVGQEMMLYSLWTECGLTRSDLAKQLCVEAPTVTKMLQRMERAELIERRVDVEDGRISRVHITEKGRALKGTIEQAWQTLEAKAFADFTSEERLLLRSMLMHLYENLTTNDSPE